MIAIAEKESSAFAQVPAFAFRTVIAETLASGIEQFDAVLAFNYLHLVRDVQANLALY
ncbi:hypothetical protein [Paracoccus sp. (in: a-proteobacteria)]|uniref:hypothetical protein n=1 Tax=Paracoccus sp. TaxID=267 RepID=UPI00396CEF6D